MSTAAFLIIGNEILSGRTKDANLAYLAAKLTEWGVGLREVRVVADDGEAIIAAVQHLSSCYDYLFTSGGIGPTHDDITAENVAKAMGSALHLDPAAHQLLQNHYLKSGLELNEARLKMAYLPIGASHIENPVSTAPGFQIGNVFVMAGVPKIFQAMVDGLRPRLQGGPPVLSRSLVTRRGEGDIAQALGREQERFPDVDMGSYPFMRMGNFGVNIVLRSPDKERLDQAFAAIWAMIEGLGDTPEEQAPVSSANGSGS